MLDNKNYNNLLLANMDIVDSISVNCKTFCWIFLSVEIIEKIFNCNVMNYDIFSNSNIERLIIQNKLYMSNKNMFDSLKLKLVIKDDLEDIGVDDNG